MNTRLATLVVRYRRSILAAIGMTTLATSWIAWHLRYDFTPQALFAGQHDLTDFNERIKKTFGHTDHLLLVVQVATGADDVLAPNALNWHLKLCQQLVDLPGIDEIDALATVRVPRPRLLGRSSLKLIPVIQRAPIDANEAALIRRRVADQPLLEGALVSADRRAMAILLHLDPARKDIQNLTQQVQRVEHLLAAIPLPDGYSVFLGGLPFLRVEIVQNLKWDQITIIPLCILAFVFIEAAMYRCWSGIVIPAVAILVGLSWTLAALVLLDQSLTILSNVLPVLLMIVAVSTCVHFLNCYAQQSVIHPTNKDDAVRETVRQMVSACFLTSLTTAIGFLSLLFAQSDLLSDFGWQAALGIGLFYIASMLSCATLASLFHSPHSITRKNNRQALLLARMAWAFGKSATCFPRLTMMASALLIVWAIWIGSSVQIDSVLTETFEEDHPQVARMHLIENQLGGFMPMEVVLTAKYPEMFQQVTIWNKLLEFEAYVRTRSEVALYRSLVDLYRQVDRLLPGGPQLENLAIQDLYRQKTRLHEIARALSRQSAQNVSRKFMTSDGLRSRFHLRLRANGTRQANLLAVDLAQKLGDLFPPESGIEYCITGESYVASVALDRFIRDLVYSLVGISIIIFLVIGLLLRSPRLALISILPNLVPLVLTLGYIGMRGYTLSMSNIIVFAISLGIAVDDTIHFLARFREEIQGETDVVAALERTCLGSGRAIVMTTILIVCGLSILHLSAFVPTRRFAELTTVTMISALLGDLLLLPACLRLFWKPSQQRPQQTFDKG